MKRLHIHISVDDLALSTTFYSRLFGTAPTVQKADYAKWLLDDPRVNFAISQRGQTPGLNHLGIQVDSDSELSELKAQLQQAELALHSELGTTCCYARSDKHWLQDPTGIAWETYHTLDSAPTFHAAADDASACCTPLQQIKTLSRKGPAAR